MVINYKRLNDNTLDNSYKIPNKYKLVNCYKKLEMFLNLIVKVDFGK